MTNFVSGTFFASPNRQIETVILRENRITNQFDRKTGQFSKALNKSDLKGGKPGFFGQALYWKDN